MTSQQRPNVERELNHLKDFQRATVEVVHRRLWTDADHGSRFLVADEVGLGKTMVARGVIARTIDHLWDTEDRIDVVYICSNSQIARQNLGRLALSGYDVDADNHADRLTMLPLALKDLKRNKVNFISFTPGTSFAINETGGKAGERALLQHMLAASQGKHLLSNGPWLRFFRGASGLDSYKATLSRYDKTSYDTVFAQRLGEDLGQAEFDGAPFLTALDECVAGFRYLRGKAPYEVSRRRYRLIGQMRYLVALAAVEALEPDLVILDEFQRFKDLLTAGNPSADLAHAIFNQKTSRVLLLSATPYKMYTLPDEPEGDDHYQDFRRTVEFLAGPEEATAVVTNLRDMRHALLDGQQLDVASAAKDDVERRLRRCMSRTERATSTDQRDAMLEQRPSPATTPTSTDLLAYASATKITACVPKTQDVFEYWRSSPYVLNIMDSYQIKQRITAAMEGPSPELLAAFRDAHGLLDWNTVERYQELDPGNAKMRGLVQDVLDRGAWQLLWLPPSLPYYEPAGAYADRELAGFTKRLVFSAWAVVPKAISLILSYEAERRAVGAAGAAGGTAMSRDYSATRPTGLLRFQVRAEARGVREAGMPVLGLVYPSVTLARLGDPLNIAREAGSIPLERERLLATVRQRLAPALNALPDPGGAEDERWYWAAPLLLDQLALGPEHDDFLEVLSSWGDDDSDDHESQQARHIQAARDIRQTDLGARPRDLVEVLALLAVAGLGPSSLRALSRVSGGADALPDLQVRLQSCFISWGLRSLFNRPEATSVVRGSGGSEPYWQAVLQHCFDGNLQACLDEYVHVLLDSEGLQDKDPLARAEQLSDVLERALTLRAATAAVDHLQTDGSSITSDRHTMRAHFAVRFGQATDEEKRLQREGQVRGAFNSPFWPFVLASTSVGQEGLDFHPYSHAVVHWNLPGNPVDLEQREGRVHRFKGHAVRRNIALTHGQVALGEGDDPWAEMFAAAKADHPGNSDLTPYWVYAPEGGYSIERYVPVSPLSKEAARFARLLRTVGAYRLVMGQPRQEDLLRYLGNSVEHLEWLHVNLAPRPQERARSDPSRR